MFPQVFARKTESIRANNMDIDIPKFKSSIHLIFYLNSLVIDVSKNIPESFGYSP